LIVSTTKVTIIAKNLETKGVSLFFKPLIERCSPPLFFPFGGRATIDMVNSQKLNIGFTTTGASRATISHKGGKFNLLTMLMLTLSAFIRMCLAIFRLMIHLSLPVLVIVFKGAFSCLHLMIGIPFSLIRWWMTICIKAGQTIRLHTFFTEFFKRFYFPAFRTSLVHIIII